VAEAEAQREGLVGLVVHAGQQIDARRAIALPANARQGGPERPLDAQLLPGGRQLEPLVATLTRVLDELWGFLAGGHS
jgi:hypothetical protein